MTHADFAQEVLKEWNLKPWQMSLTMYGKEQDRIGGLLYTHLVCGDNEFDVCNKCAVKMYSGQTVLRKEVLDK